MKKVISSLLVAAMAICVNTAKADNISLEEAREAAAYYMGYYTGADKLSANDLTLVHQIDNEKLGVPASYFFNVGSDGWIIMAGTTIIDPIIGYSAEGSLVMEDLPANMLWWVNGYTKMVKGLQEFDAENDYTYPDHEVWTALKGKSYKGDTKANQHVLTQMTWGQGDANTPTYNMLCPQDTGGRYSMVGCVATAMSQMMRYYRYPSKASGTAIYVLRSVLANADKQKMPNIQLKINYDTMEPFDFDKMPNKPTSGGHRICSEENMREVARLSYYAGVAVHMGYTPDGSGAYSPDVPNAMKKHFKYTQGTVVYRDRNASTYMDRIRAVLTSDNVAYMGGVSSTGEGRDAAGHAWLCVGYMENNVNQYYMNWGWEGGGNGFFNLGGNNMPIQYYGYNFNQNQEFIEGMVPDNGVGIDQVDGSELGDAYPNPAIHAVTLPYNTPNATNMVIYNIEGKVVATYPVHAGTGELTVNVEGMPTGMYIYRMNSVSGRFMVK
ncbi:MAG: thiol protease/hemagglutinin PrtT [Bacteroidales bacterium]|nr:thiol protease/hemagglutinin PrtT [Bacteroidales bacterium]